MDVEDNNYYEENEIIVGEEGEGEGEGEEGGEYNNIIEEENIHKEGDEESKKINLFIVYKEFLLLIIFIFTC